MANIKISELTADTAPTADDLVATVNDPGGTPATRKSTITNFTKAIPAVIGDSGSGGTKGLAPAPAAGDAAAGKFLKADGTWAAPAGGSGGLGDVVGPASAVDDRVAVFDGTTGKLIKDGGSTIADIIAAGGSGTFVGGEFDQYKLISYTSRPGTTTLDPVNAAAAATASGGGTAAVTNANGAFIRYTSAGSLDADAGWHANNTALISDIACLPQTVTKLMTYTSIAVVRFWIGMFDSSPLASADPAVSGAGFRFDTSASDANWQAWTNDGSGGGTITDTGIAVSTSTLYHLSIKVVSASSIEFYISTNNGASYSLVATHTTNLPATGVPFNYYSMLRTLEAVVKSIQHGWTHIRVR